MKTWWVLVLAFATSVWGGCAKVPAYQRSLLMSPIMQGPSPLDASFDAHVDGTRELMNGAGGGGGASCGCT